MNVDMAYLLGMITGNGTIQRANVDTTICIEIPHKKLQTEFEADVKIYVKASIADIRARLDPLLGVSSSFNQSPVATRLTFTKPNADYLMCEILRLLGNAQSSDNVRISSEVFNFTFDERVNFIKGFGDVTGYIRRSNYAFQKENHRVYFEVPQNWYLVIDFCNLLRTVDMPVQTIDWGHPNMRDPYLVKYKNNNPFFWKKEHQIKVWACEYKPIGFEVQHKQLALEYFAKEQIDANQGKTSSFHKYYWQRTGRVKTKPQHPCENDNFIPAAIRGKHFNSWTEIADALGYRQ